MQAMTEQTRNARKQTRKNIASTPPPHPPGWAATPSSDPLRESPPPLVHMFGIKPRCWEGRTERLLFFRGLSTGSASGVFAEEENPVNSAYCPHEIFSRIQRRSRGVTFI